MDFIKIRGARVHNLKNISLDIPKNKLVVFTGVSGSGKSSLAFDTIYAEGQRRYVESLSSYARQFLGIMEKPDVDLIEGLSPAISIDQKTASHNPRSTVGTVTEVYDYLRLLFARVGHPHCPNCGREIKKMSEAEIVKLMREKILELSKQDKQKPIRFFILSPVVRERKGEFLELFDNLRFKGYTRVRIDGYFYGLDEDLFLLKNNKHSIEVVMDKFSVSYKYLTEQKNLDELLGRLSKAIENSLLLSEGLVKLGQVLDSGFDFPSHPKNLSEELYSEKFACPVCNLSFAEIEPRLFSFNSPIGACGKCKGLGTIMRVAEEKIVNPDLTIAEGALFPFQKLLFADTWKGRIFKTFLEERGINSNVPIKRLGGADKEALFWGSDKVYSVRGRNREGNPTTIYEKWPGIIPEMEKKYYDTESEWARGELEQYMREETCPECSGARLKKEVLAITINQINIDQFCNLGIEGEIKFIENCSGAFSEKEKTIASPIVKEIKSRLQFLSQVGLGYLTLARRARTLSGGEAQRIRLASQIGTGLTGITYVLDEPSIGLHSRDVSQLLTALKKLRDLSNSLIVVEHDWETIQESDWLVDFGPLAGKRGGEVIFSGERSELIKNKKSITGQYLSKKRFIPVVRAVEKNENFLNFSGCSAHNLKNIDVKIPLGRLVGITGVSGSGKSSLLLDTVAEALDKAINANYRSGSEICLKQSSGFETVERLVIVDQSPIGRTPRSNPATYTNVFSPIRDIFAESQEAKAKGYTPGRFSFNVKGGRCENCQGAGLIKVEMQFLADVYVKCDICNGRRYNNETLEVKFKGKNIAEILKMSVDEALEFFKNHNSVWRILKVMQEVGLGYIELGQAAPTLSGGEAQRIKLAKELYTAVTKHTVYILDEPTTGLHMYDVDKLIKVLRNLVSQGNTVIVIEHNLDVIKNCDWLIDLGPEGGEKGGEVIYMGETGGIIKEKKSYTGKYLEEYLR